MVYPGRIHLAYWQQQVLRGLAAVLFFGAIAGAVVLYQSHKPAASNAGAPVTASNPVPAVLRGFHADNPDLARTVESLTLGYTDNPTDVGARAIDVARQCSGLVQRPAFSSDHDRAFCRTFLDSLQH